MVTKKKGTQFYANKLEQKRRGKCICCCFPWQRAKVASACFGERTTVGMWQV